MSSLGGGRFESPTWFDDDHGRPREVMSRMCQKVMMSGGGEHVPEWEPVDELRVKLRGGAT
jgi:hypothetical protein